MADIYLLCTSGALSLPSIRGPFSRKEAEIYLTIDTEDPSPAVAVAVLSDREAAEMLHNGKYLDMTSSGLGQRRRESMAA